MEQLRVQRIAAFYELDEFDFDVLGGLTQALGAVGTHPRQRGRPGRGTRGGGGEDGWSGELASNSKSTMKVGGSSYVFSPALSLQFQNFFLQISWTFSA